MEMAIYMYLLSHINTIDFNVCIYALYTHHQQQNTTDRPKKKERTVCNVLRRHYVCAAGAGVAFTWHERTMQCE